MPDTDTKQRKRGRGGARKGAGRPRVYDSPAARQAAHRARRRVEAQQHAARLETLATRAALTLKQQRELEAAAQFIRERM